MCAILLQETVKSLPISSIDLQAEELVFEFAFHPITKEYKEIKIVYYAILYHDDPWLLQISTSEVQVFTLGGNSWRSIGEASYQINGSQGYMLNRKMHWLTRLGSCHGRHDRLIVSFDLAKEVFGEVPKVDFNLDLRIGKFPLAVLRGCLAVSVTLPHQNGGGTEIWLMKEYNVKESWVKEYIIGAYTTTPNSVTQHLVRVEEWRALASVRRWPGVFINI
ncbi:F-box protein At3g07870-like [Nicotiana tomentosiformis]|uniref:F-box protein At3g07870-like n=1 Tax=Nicotiana tomentosiformis TaxID=4098 RepID=UPI00388C54F7